MAFIDKLKEELDRAGRAAQGALDEGKARLEAFRTRQLADKAAQALGYAVFRAKQNGGEIDADTYSRLAATLATHDAEAAKYEAELELRRTQNRAGTPADRAASSTADAASSAAADVWPGFLFVNFSTCEPVCRRSAAKSCIDP
jgi:hypothetical protein